MTECVNCAKFKGCNLSSPNVNECADYKEILTNEDWFCSLDTEQKAEWLTNSGFLTCTLRDCEDCKYYDKNNDDCIDGYEATHDKQMWVKWLKEMHK